MKEHNKIIYVGILIALLALQATQSSARQDQVLEQRMHEIFDSTMTNDIIPSGIFLLHGGDQDIHLGLAGGTSQGREVTAQTPFYTASITKTLTATAIVLLAEDGLLDFDDSIADHLPVELLDGLHVFEGKDYSTGITIAQLLTHQSGLPDYWNDIPVSGENMMSLLLERPDYFWQPEELIAFTKANFKARFAPGTAYHYTDTEYVLLGIIIQRLTDMPLHDFFRRRIFEPLDMHASWMHQRSAPIDPSAPMAGLHVGKDDISGLISLSADWADGGLVSTSEDLFRFMRGLFDGRLVSQASLEHMQSWIPESYGTYYGYGLRKWELKSFSPQLGNLTLIGHSGSSSAFMFYCPELDVYITGTFNQIAFMKDHVRFVMKIMADYLAHEQGERSEP